MTPSNKTEVKTTLEALVRAQPVLQRLSEVRRSATEAYRLSRVVKAVAEEAAYFESQRVAIITQLANPDNPTTVPPERMEDFRKLVTEVLAIEVTLSFFPLTIDMLGDVSAGELLALGPLVQFPESD